MSVKPREMEVEDKREEENARLSRLYRKTGQLKWRERACALGVLPSNDNDTLQAPKPSSEGLFIGCTETIGLLFGNDLETEVFGAGERVDFSGVKDLPHWDDLDRGILLVILVEGKTLRTQNNPSAFPLAYASLNAETLEITLTDDSLGVTGDRVIRTHDSGMTGSFDRHERGYVVDRGH